MSEERVVAESVLAAVPAALRPLVVRSIGYRYEGQPPGVDLGLPSRHVTVVISPNTPLSTIVQTDHGRRPRAFTALAGGLHVRPVLLPHDGTLSGVQLDLTPQGARVLLGLPAGRLARSILPLHDLLGADADELVDRIGSATSWTDRFAALHEVLLRRRARLADRTGEPPAPLAHTWRRLAASDGAVRIGALAEDAGWSRRHLSQRFTAEYGLTPKEAARVMRFERSRRLLERPGRPPLARLAVACGYYDQAHLTREWKAIVGLPPSAWLGGERLPFVQDDDGPGSTG